MLISWINLADDATVSTDSEESTLPASNVQHEHLSRKWYTEEGVATAYLLFDFGSSLAADVLAVLGTNLTADATIRVRASDADPTALSSLLLDTGVLAGGVDPDFGALYKQFASTTARYWRLSFDDPSAADNLRVGRVFIGATWEPTYNMLLGVAYGSLDPSLVLRSRAGQRYAEEMPKQRMIQFDLAFLSESEMFGNAFALANRNGIVHDVLVIPDIASSYLSQRSVFGPCVALSPIVNDVLYLYRQRFAIEERL